MLTTILSPGRQRDSARGRGDQLPPQTSHGGTILDGPVTLKWYPQNGRLVVTEGGRKKVIDCVETFTVGGIP